MNRNASKRTLQRALERRYKRIDWGSFICRTHVVDKQSDKPYLPAPDGWKLDLTAPTMSKINDGFPVFFGMRGNA